MTESLFAAFFTIGFLIIVNIIAVSYTYGKLAQKVDNNRSQISSLVDGITTLEKRINQVELKVAILHKHE